MSEEPTTVYILWNDDKEVIYVGITGVKTSRLHQHARDKTWWTEVRGARFVHYDTRAEALAAEESAIKKWRPPYNTMHARETVAAKKQRVREEPYMAFLDKIVGPKTAAPRVSQGHSGPYTRSGIG